MTNMELPKTGNTVWFNRAFVYYYKSKKPDVFRGEFLFIMKELGVIPRYNYTSKDKEGNTDNI